MPMNLPREDWPRWLGEDPAEPAELLSLLRPCPPEMVIAWPVTRRVNKVAENDAGLLARDPFAVVPPALDSPMPDFAE
jgi:putative SOS response-associated peptidase YedK